jgi:hypothetical protein
MVGFVQELKQTSQLNRILENAQHFDMLGKHIKDNVVSSRFIQRC